MDREIPIANRVVYSKIQKQMRKKHLMKLNEIKNKTPSLSFSKNTLHQKNENKHNLSSTYLQRRNLQIEKNNIVLFNRIADIIRHKHKPMFNSSASKISRKSPSKRYSNIKTENEKRRISQQQPTIKNINFYMDRKKNEKYLKFIGRYPYIKPRKINTQASFHQTLNQLKNLEDYNIRIYNDVTNSQVIFLITDQKQVEYKLQMNIHQFRRELQLNSNSMTLMVKRLRLNNQGIMIYQNV